MNSTASNRILIVEDEQAVVDMLTLNLKKAGGFTVSVANDGADGLKKAREELPSLVILDLMLPKIPGAEVCKVLKNDGATRHIPIIMLTAKADAVDQITGSEAGADHYVTKPFSPREIVSRINAVMRRGQRNFSDGLLTAGIITLNPARHQVSVAGKRVRLTAVEFKLLRMLMLRRGHVQTRDRLLNEAWGYEISIDTRTVDTHVRRLRKKLGKAADAIETVRGFGYRMRDGAVDSAAAASD
jgi:two-component system phosphate regulon response regulator PhoB